MGCLLLERDEFCQAQSTLHEPMLAGVLLIAINVELSMSIIYIYIVYVYALYTYIYNMYFVILACPTCNDFHGLVQKIMELQDILAKTSAKVMFTRSHGTGGMRPLKALLNCCLFRLFVCMWGYAYGCVGSIPTWLCLYTFICVSLVSIHTDSYFRELSCVLIFRIEQYLLILKRIHIPANKSIHLE